MGLFGEKKDPKDQVREWTRKLQREQRTLDRQIGAIQKEEAKVKLSIKQAAKKGELDSCKILAREIVNSRKAVGRLYTAKAQMNSVAMEMKNQQSLVRVTGCLAQSTEAMKSMQQLVKVSEVSATMRDLSKEMMKAGIFEEMIEDTMEMVFDDEDLEVEADAEVENILFDLTAGALGKAPAAGAKPLPQQQPAVVESEDEEELDEMRERLAALKS